MLDIIIDKIGSNTPLTDPEKMFLKQWFSNASSTVDFVGGIRTTSGIKVNTLETNVVVSKTPVSKVIHYLVQSAFSLAAFEGYTPVPWDGSYFGSAGDSLSSACVNKVAGSNTKFKLAPSIPDGTPIRIWGHIAFFPNTPVAGGIGWSVSSYNSDGSGGSGQFGETPTTTGAEYPTLEWDIVDTLYNDAYWQIEAINYTSGVLDLSSAELNFALA